MWWTCYCRHWPFPSEREGRQNARHQGAAGGRTHGGSQEPSPAALPPRAEAGADSEGRRRLSRTRLHASSSSLTPRWESQHSHAKARRCGHRSRCVQRGWAVSWRRDTPQQGPRPGPRRPPQPCVLLHWRRGTVSFYPALHGLCLSPEQMFSPLQGM